MLSQWQRAMVILQRDAYSSATTAHPEPVEGWQGDKLRLGQATWYQRGNKVLRHDGKSRHAVALIDDVQAMRIQQGSVIIVYNNKEYQWPILCSP